MNEIDLLEALDKIPDRAFSLVVHSYAGEGDDLRRRGVDVVLGRPAKAEEMVQAVKTAIQRRRNAGKPVVNGLDSIDHRLEPPVRETG
jgi:DNA-binding NarL/FixJ family response regulator